MDLLPFIIPLIIFFAFMFWAIFTWPKAILKKTVHWYEYTIEQHDWYQMCDEVENFLNCQSTKWRIIQNRTKRKNLNYFNL